MVMSRQMFERHRYFGVHVGLAFRVLKSAAISLLQSRRLVFVIFYYLISHFLFGKSV